jgi:hypothetical protein
MQYMAKAPDRPKEMLELGALLAEAWHLNRSKTAMGNEHLRAMVEGRGYHRHAFLSAEVAYLQGARAEWAMRGHEDDANANHFAKKILQVPETSPLLLSSNRNGAKEELIKKLFTEAYIPDAKLRDYVIDSGRFLLLIGAASELGVHDKAVLIELEHQVTAELADYVANQGCIEEIASEQA